MKLIFSKIPTKYLYSKALSVYNCALLERPPYIAKIAAPFLLLNDVACDFNGAVPSVNVSKQCNTYNLSGTEVSGLGGFP